MKNRIKVLMGSSIAFALSGTMVLSPLFSTGTAFAAGKTQTTNSAAAQQIAEQQIVEQDVGALPADYNAQTVTEQAAAEQTQAVEEQAQQAEEKELTPEEQAKKAEEDAKLALQNDPNHVHTFKWIAKMNESETADGTLNYMCTECGKIWYYRKIAPFYAFVGEVARRIETAPQGGLVPVKTSHFISFDYEVMEALAARPDVSLYVSFLDQEYKGNRVSFVIPPGQDTMSLLDGNGYVGFIFLGNKYGLTMEVPMEVPDAPESEAVSMDATAATSPVAADTAATATSEEAAAN